MLLRPLFLATASLFLLSTTSAHATTCTMATTLPAPSAGSPVTIAVNLTSAGTVTATGSSITVNASVTVTSTGGDVVFTAHPTPSQADGPILHHGTINAPSGNISLNGSPITINGALGCSTAVVQGTGTVALNAAAAYAVNLTTAKLQLGGTIGTLTATSGTVVPAKTGTTTGDLNLQAGSTLDVQLDGVAATAYGHLSAAAVSLAQPGLSVHLGYVPTLGDSFTVVHGSSLTGSFAGLADGATLSVGTTALRIHYTATDVLLTVVPNTTTTVSSSMNPSVFGQTVRFTATVANLLGGAAPTGMVVFTLDGAAQPAVALSGGLATLEVGALAVGAHTVSASYGGDGATLQGSTSADLQQTVTTATTTTQLASSATPAMVGEAIAFTATVAVLAPSAGTPTGMVTFLDGATPLGSASLGAGQAVYTTSSLTVGTHAITAVYAGDANFTGSGSSALSEEVAAAPQPDLAMSADLGAPDLSSPDLSASDLAMPMGEEHGGCAISGLGGGRGATWLLLLAAVALITRRRAKSL